MVELVQDAYNTALILEVVMHCDMRMFDMFPGENVNKCIYFFAPACFSLVLIFFHDLIVPFHSNTHGSSK